MDGTDEGQTFMVEKWLDRDTETKARNFVLDPGLHWKPVTCYGQQCYTHMPWIMDDKLGSMTLHAPKFILFVAKETS